MQRWATMSDKIVKWRARFHLAISVKLEFCRGSDTEAFGASFGGAFQRPRGLALQLRFLWASESMGNHDSKIVDAGSVD
jgi:hypothetical protein